METLEPVFTDEQIDQFIENGFIRLDHAFSKETAQACRAALWRETGLDPDDPTTWTEPVVRVWESSEEPFIEAANTPRLRAAYDQLVGRDRWVPMRTMGTFPIRFPHKNPPQDVAWHVDGSYQSDNDPFFWLNLRSRDRALLVLFLYSDVTEDDGPTRVRVGSHLDVPPLLEPAGEAGMSLRTLIDQLSCTEGRPEALVTGEAGDVYLVHPFTVHSAQEHRGKEPRFLAQPQLFPQGTLVVDGGPGTEYNAVERAIRKGLGRSDQG
ncbi:MULTISPECIES: phytanoyl-CoA dioxygenase family protein [Streptomyces]|uniref:Phytanoyl-CoA dioxygenase n=2 Tax=Streptomyces TaxID=1883 RepID=A0A4Q9HWB4_STRKA|nr:MULTISPECIES: phytanoyl-CoA dioxygenase family protein [Streptomyces]MYU50942.1 phytanoyl-CoA dioxygenase [Streptomyces sp. SID7805]TBO59255.1 phytanoyl-CoA dioxygenase [Streptomyces kasugaensis]WSK14246.1 phytanoyl-CoA dioxygenase family protein [Streptomyces celluloflavus]